MFSTIGYYICVPFAALLRLFYTLTGSYGWSLVLFTLVVKLVLLPFQLKSKKSMMRMSSVQPRMKELQTRYANNPTKMNAEIQALYAEEGVNPMGGCLWSFLPFPILIALYSIIRQPLSRFMMLTGDVVKEVSAFAASMGFVNPMTAAYEEIGVAKFISQNFDAFSAKFTGLVNMEYSFLGMDLSAVPKDHLSELTTGGWPVIGLFLMILISCVLSFLLSAETMKGNPSAGGGDAAARSAKTMTYTMPLLSLYIGYIMPGALAVYWIANSVFSIIQEATLNKYFKEKFEREEEERVERRRTERQARMEAAKQQQLREGTSEKKGDKKIAEKRAAKQIAKQTGEKKSATTENGRVGERPYARGRAFMENRYDD